MAKGAWVCKLVLFATTMTNELTAMNPTMPRWLLWSVLALLSWGVWAIMAKLIGEALSGAHNQALSTLGVLPIMLAIGVSKRVSPPGNRRCGILYALAAGSISCLGNVVYYDALSRGSKAAMIVPLTALYPLTTILLAMLLLKERLNRIQLAGVLVSLVAIYLFNVQREEGFFSRWLMYALGPIVLWGASGFLQKLSTNHISGELATLCFLGAFIPFGVLFLAQAPLPAQITTTTWLLVIAQGFFLALGNLAVLAAFARQGKAPIVTPLTALYPLVSVPMAICFLGERVGAREAAGILLALVSVAMLSRETPAHDLAQTAAAQATQPAP
jgi:transporter family protein